jgi:hypothetical protein
VTCFNSLRSRTNSRPYAAYQFTLSAPHLLVKNLFAAALSTGLPGRLRRLADEIDRCSLGTNPKP